MQNLLYDLENREKLYDLWKKVIDNKDEQIIKEYVIKVLAWGYPTWRIGSYSKSINPLLNSEFEKIVKIIKDNNSWDILKNLHGNIKWLWISTISKLLYFIDNNYPILDLKIISALNNNLFINWINIKYNEIESYNKYIEILHSTISKYKNENKIISIGQLEMFLFIFGNILRYD